VKYINSMILMIRILYATSTGTAEDVAFSIARKFSTAIPGLLTHVCDIEDYDFFSLLPEEKYVLFVASTTGEGDAPPSMKCEWGYSLVIHIDFFSVCCVTNSNLLQTFGRFYFENRCHQMYSKI